MKTNIFGVCSLLFFAASIYAQVSPNPVADAELRDGNSIRMRSLQFERIKRDASSTHPVEISKELQIKLAKIKDDFENIQKLQFSIVKTYTTGKNINYQKIGALALEMRKKAGRLGVNFFNIKEENSVTLGSHDLIRKNVRDLIIDIDDTMTAFVSSPAFTTPQVIDAKSNDKARADLEKLFDLSIALQEAAEAVSHMGQRPGK